MRWSFIFRILEDFSFVNREITQAASFSSIFATTHSGVPNARDCVKAGRLEPVARHPGAQSGGQEGLAEARPQSERRYCA